MIARSPLPPSDAPTMSLNRSEWAYLASDPFLGSMTQAYLLRLSQPVPVDTVRRAFRQLFTIYPRARAVLEPTMRRAQWRVLPEDRFFEQVFDLAFREETIDLDDQSAVMRWHELAINDPMAVYHGLTMRLTHVAHPTRPGLMLYVHHLMCDGRSIVTMIESLMKLLNGETIAPTPLDSPSMLPAVLPEHWWQWPLKLYRSWQHERAIARDIARYEIVQLPRDRSGRFTACRVLHHQTGLAAKALSQTGKRVGGSSNSLMMAGLATALLEQAGNRPGTAALLRVGVDLRRYFPPERQPKIGNYVAVFEVPVPQHVPEAERVAWIDQRVRAGLTRFEQREALLPLLTYELMGLISTQMYARLVRRTRRLDQIPMQSCHTTNIGAVDAFNSADAQIKLEELYPAVSSVAPLIVLLQVNGQQCVVTSHQRDEFSDGDVGQLMQRTREVLHRWMASAS